MTGSTAGGLRFVAAFAAAINLLLFGAALSPSAHAAGSDTMFAGQVLADNARITSPNGQYQLVMQSDGNLVVYGAGAARWWTGTNGPGRRLVMQGDGNLVIYRDSTPLWWSGTHGLSGSQLRMQDDGNLVIYGPSGRAWWSTWTGDLQPGCYGDYCSGKDPQATGCGDDARTAAWLDLTSARLELRWSARCKTNWARFEQYPRGWYMGQVPLVLRAVQDTGYRQALSYGVNGTGTGTTWSPMVYSPVRLVRAEVVFQCHGVGSCFLDAAVTKEGVAATAWG